MSNIRPIADPSLARAMVATFQSIELARSAPAGISTPRWRILQCAHAGNATSKSLQLCSGLNARALAEHVQALRWKGLMDMDGYRLSPTAILMVEGNMPPQPEPIVLAEAAPDQIVALRHAIAAMDPASLPHLSAPVIIGLDLSSRTDLMITHATPAQAAPVIEAVAAMRSEQLTPADVPACMRPDCMSPEETNNSGRGSAAVARPIKGGAKRGRVAPVRAPATREEVAGSNPAPGQPATPQTSVTPAHPPKFVSWIEQKRQRTDAAIAFLGSQGIAVSVADRDAQIRTYFLSANRRSLFAEEVIELAIEKGWAE